MWPDDLVFRTNARKDISKWVHIPITLEKDTGLGITMVCRIYNCSDFPTYLFRWNVLKSYSKGKRKVWNVPCAFDIECTTVNSPGNPYSFMYVWQFCIDGYVCMGRTWEEWHILCNRLKQAMGVPIMANLPIYVHYLSYEWQFLKDFYQWEDVFAREQRKILKCTTTTGLEFRCSYFLSNMSLEKFGEYCEGVLYTKRVDKGGEGFDYKKFRTPNSPLTNEELSYCYCDVAGLVQCIKYMMQEDNLASIPMTNTGYVRRDMRISMSKNKANRKLFTRTALDAGKYGIISDLSRGGNTHGYRGTVGKILHGVECWDISSSYPYVQMTKEFPISAFTEYGNVENEEEMYQLFEDWSVIFYVTLVEVEIFPTEPIPYISFSKCKQWSEDVELFNGRVMKASFVRLAVTEIDYQIIDRQYDFKMVAFDHVHIARKGQLPEEFKAVVLDYYVKKTQLKGIDEYMYMKAKNRLNSCFGMTFTNPVRENWTYNGHEMEKIEVKVHEALDKYYKSRNSFLPYQWGAYTTAWARLSLDEGTRLSGTNTCYVDTDSNKVQGMPKGWMDELNAGRMSTAKYYGAFAEDQKGKIHYMGVFEQEPGYDRFVTLGAKKYAYEQNGELHITIAGVNKYIGAAELGRLENMKIGYTFYEAGGTLATYNDWNRVVNMRQDGCHFTTASNIAITDSTYTLGLTDEFIEVAGLDEDLMTYISE